MTGRRPLPADLGYSFSTAEADLVGSGRSRRRASDVVAPYFGTRVVRDQDSWQARLRALSRVLPAHAQLSHDTAARLWRLPTRHAQPDDVVHVTVPRGRQRPRHAGVVGHRGDRPSALVDGLAVTELLSTWCDLASCWPLWDVVVAGDAILNRRPHASSRQYDAHDLLTAWGRHQGSRGARTARAAAALVRPGSASPQETRARLLFDLWGLPEPLLNADVLNDSGWLATVDFLWPEQRVVGEYHGETHGGSWRKDYRRQSLLADLGYTVVVMTSYDLGPGAGALQRRLTRLLT